MKQQYLIWWVTLYDVLNGEAVHQNAPRYIREMFQEYSLASVAPITRNLRAHASLPILGFGVNWDQESQVVQEIKTNNLLGIVIKSEDVELVREFNFGFLTNVKMEKV